jgi:predicted porin
MAAGPKLNSGVVNIGYHRGQYTPFFSYATISTFADIQPTGVPNLPALEPLAQAALAAQIAAQATQHTFSVGVRYDLSPHVDVKLQIDRIVTNETYLIFDRNPSPIDRDHLVVVGLAVDFIF